jgi:hypothetical protein
MSARLVVATMALVGLCGCHPVVKSDPVAGWAPENSMVVSARNIQGNGIYVQDPKVYDDASLRLALDAIRAHLGAVNGINQDTLNGHIGAVSGATISQSQVGLSVGSALPSWSTTAQSATSGSTTDSTGTSLTSTSPSWSTTTNSPTAPAAPTVPSSLAFTPPSTVSPSSLDVLNEQMQLSYQLANLQLLLEGSLTDYFVSNTNFTKQRVTLGFPITLTPRPEYKDAVAVVEIEATVNDGALSTESPSVIALLPREQTYNVAAMTDKSTSIGGGVVLGAIGLGGSFLSAHKTLYLVKDQDTVAVMLPPPKDPDHPTKPRTDTVRFAWEFHPVLGESYVRGGPKQTFVQLAFPMLSGDDVFGSVRLRTYWRRFDKETGLVGDVISGSVFAKSDLSPVQNFKSKLDPIIDHARATDLGDGTLEVAVEGTFRAGTYVELGPNRFDVSKNLVADDTGLRFVAPASAFAQWTARIVSRSGQWKKLVLEPGPICCALAACKHWTAIRIPDDPTVEPFDESKSTLKLTVESLCSTGNPLPDDLLLAVGGKVFGLKDAPIQRTPGRGNKSMTMSAVVPTRLLTGGSARVMVFAPLWSDVDGASNFSWNQDRPQEDLNSYYAVKELPSFASDSDVDHLVLVSVDKDGKAKFVLYGNNLDGATIVSPTSGATLDTVPGIGGKQTRYVTLVKPALAEAKKIVLMKPKSKRPVVLDVPKIPSDKPDASASKVSIDGPLVQGAQDVDVSAQSAAEVKTVTLKGKPNPLQWKATGDSSGHLTGLKDDGVTADQRTVELTFLYNDGSTEKVSVDVVAARVYVKQPAPPKKSE